MVKAVIRIFRIWGLRDGLRVIAYFFISKIKRGFGNAYLKVHSKCISIESLGFRLNSSDSYFKVKDFSFNITVFCRKFSSDLEVFNQIIVNRELDDLIKFVLKKKIVVNTIVDAGGNIGLSTIVFARSFPGARIITIEPDKGNFEILSRNCSINKVAPILLNLGLWSSSRRLYFDYGFRGGREWSITLTELPNENQFIDSTSINDILKEYSLETIDILKIDIEGGERYIFDENSEYGIDFLDKVKIVAVEIHDEFDISDSIKSIFHRKNFSMFNSGEYLIAINGNFE